MRDDAPGLSAAGGVAPLTTDIHPYVTDASVCGVVSRLLL